MFSEDEKSYGGFIPFTHEKEDVEYHAFTNLNIQSDYWNVHNVDLKFDNNARKTARWYKTHPHEVLDDHDVSVWMDNQCYFTVRIQDLVQQYIGDKHDFFVHRHGDMDCCYQEGFVSHYHYNLDNPEKIYKQLARYSEDKFPIHAGLFETGILLRRNIDSVKELNEMWWNEIDNYSIRDQISLPWVLSKNTNVRQNLCELSFTAHPSNIGRNKSPFFKTIPRDKIPSFTNR